MTSAGLPVFSLIRPATMPITPACQPWPETTATRAAVEVSSQIFELTGAGSTSSRFGLDRFWRNARVHTLHDPIDYKLRDLGRHALTSAFPEPTSYS